MPSLAWNHLPATLHEISGLDPTLVVEAVSRLDGMMTQKWHRGENEGIKKGLGLLA
uniref:Uncharacterized protein n=1 Tax=Magnetococcus massalia (strain MO-1) TaxID=451514 RepID=A0A1S7LMX9_MAGMO|nr:protein of unknown function [Candidatus Magnetococcus massalia]